MASPRRSGARSPSTTVRSYREAMRAFSAMRDLEVWYSHLSVDQAFREFSEGVDPKRLKKIEADIAKSRTKDSMHAFSKLTRTVDGEPRIISDPPLIVPIDELAPAAVDRNALQSELHDIIRSYRRTLETDRRHLLEQFRFVDLARKVVGVGSVGTRAWIALCLGVDDDDPLFLQLKEAQPSVLERFVGKSQYAELWPAGRRRPATDAGDERHLPRLAARGCGSRRAGQRLLRPPAEGLEGLDSRSRRPSRLERTPTAEPAAGHSHALTLAPATGSRSLRTSAGRTPSTRRSRTSRRPTPTRTNATTRRCRTP